MVSSSAPVSNAWQTAFSVLVNSRLDVARFALNASAIAFELSLEVVFECFEQRDKTG